MKLASPTLLFDINKLRARRARANRIAQPDAGFLARIASETILDRLAVTIREFPVSVDLFSLSNDFFETLDKLASTDKVYKVGYDPQPSANGLICASNPEAIPLGAGSCNLITSVFGLHWSNDLPGTFTQIRQSLAPDGLFTAAFPGDQTLNELRQCLIEAETELTGGVSLRVDPFGEVRQIGNLLQRAGFALPVVDSETFTVRYDSLFHLVKDLRAMGVTSCLEQTNKPVPRDYFSRADEIYRKKFSDQDGRIRATFEIIFASGWAPHESQQKPLKPGAAKNRFADYL